MATFNILTGAALAKAIAGQGKAVATFTAREHQLAYSALNHVELHNDPKHLNALFDVTPANYRRGLVSWATAFGKVTFDPKTKAFVYAKGKASDLEKALDIAPANYAREANATVEKTAKPLIDRAEALAKRTLESDDSSADDKAFARALAEFVVARKRATTRPVIVPTPAKAKAEAVKAAKVEEVAAAA